VNWAYGRRSEAIKKYAPDDMEIDTCSAKETPWGDIGKYDLIYQLEYCAPIPRKFRGRGFNGAWIVAFNSSPGRKDERWHPVLRHADYVILNNESSWDYFGREDRTCCVSNGVDSSVFKHKTPIEDRPNRVLWCGSSSKGKNYHTIVKPLRDIAESNGFETGFRPIDEITEDLMTGDEMCDWYNSGRYILCTSDLEATPNTILEGMACGCIPVSSRTGNLLEFGEDGKSCLFAEKTSGSFMEKLNVARDGLSHFSEHSMSAIKSWSYGEPGNRAEYFYHLFRRILRDGIRTIPPFTYSEKHWSEI